MKKTFDNFAQCMELREVIFLKTLPSHPHLVPSYDIFLDPYSKKLHIAMENMDGNLYQLMKARDLKPLDCASVKSILFQIMSGLEHIHNHSFFHRDIKPENILVSTSAISTDTASTFRRYSSLVTPPSTPPTYSIKIADFGLARDMQSRVPYTTYVSTRWYRAPEVLLRAGEYSAPVDIWAIGAMAVEIATLKPLFPGGNEVDQVWRVCEYMGSPANWVNKHGQGIGGGEWKEGIRLAQKLGFSFPKMVPHTLDSLLPEPQWPASFANFVAWCLMWDPKLRPTSRQALEHEFFFDAVDPLRPKSSHTARVLARKSAAFSPSVEQTDSQPQLSTKTSSWFRKSLPAREAAPPAVPSHSQTPYDTPARQSPMPTGSIDTPPPSIKSRTLSTKRATWMHGSSSNVAPIPILPSIRPVSPKPHEVNAQASTRYTDQFEHRKIGRQLSVNSQGNQYAEMHRQEAERILNGGNGVKTPTSSGKESFFSHLRKRARRLSGRYPAPLSPNPEDVEANAGCAPWQGNRQSIAPMAMDPSSDPNFADLDRALRNVRDSVDVSANPAITSQQQQQRPRQPIKMMSSPSLERQHSLPYGDPATTAPPPVPMNFFSRNRKSFKQPSHGKYDIPNEADELLDEAIASAHTAAQKLDKRHSATIRASQQPARPPIQQVFSDPGSGAAAYLTPSHSKDDMSSTGLAANYYTSTKPMNIPQGPRKYDSIAPQWPTPPYDENDWAAAAAASIFATQQAFR